MVWFMAYVGCGVMCAGVVVIVDSYGTGRVDLDLGFDGDSFVVVLAVMTAIVLLWPFFAALALWHSRKWIGRKIRRLPGFRWWPS